MPEINRDKVCFIVVKARELLAEAPRHEVAGY
jgi:hypothetical protein